MKINYNTKTITAFNANRIFSARKVKASFFTTTSFTNLNRIIEKPKANFTNIPKFPFNARLYTNNWVPFGEEDGFAEIPETNLGTVTNTLKTESRYYLGKTLEYRFLPIIYKPMFKDSVLNDYLRMKPYRLEDKTIVLLLLFNTVISRFNSGFDFTDFDDILQSQNKSKKDFDDMNLLSQKIVFSKESPYPYETFLVFTYMATLEDLLPELDTPENFESVPKEQRKNIIIAGQFNYVFSAFKKQGITPYTLFKIIRSLRDVFINVTTVLAPDYTFPDFQKKKIMSADFLLRPKLERYLKSYSIFYCQGLQKSCPNDSRVLDIFLAEIYYKKNTMFPPVFYETSYFKKEFEGKVAAHYDMTVLRATREGKENFLDLPKLPKLPNLPTDLKKKRGKPKLNK